MRRRWLNIRKALLGWVLPGLRVLPPRVATRAVARIGRAEYVLLPGLRRRVDAAVERGRLYFNAHWDRPAVGRLLVGNQILWRNRDRLLDGVPDARAEGLFVVEGHAALDEAIARGRGVILLTNHFGASLMPAHWLTRQGYTLRWLSERPRHVSKLLSRDFDTDGPLGQRRLFISRRSTPAESAGAILRASKILAAGSILMIANDVRWSGPNAVPAAFLGRTHEFSGTWVLLAALTGVPVVPAFCRITADGAHHLEFLDPYRVPPEVRRPSQAVPWVQRSLDLIEERVRLYPDNSNDYFFWAEAESEDAADGEGA
jgi:phosphatidylinositol dimannoside acyltransferase